MYQSSRLHILGDLHFYQHCHENFEYRFPFHSIYSSTCIQLDASTIIIIIINVVVFIHVAACFGNLQVGTGHRKIHQRLVTSQMWNSKFKMHMLKRLQWLRSTVQYNVYRSSCLFVCLFANKQLLLSQKIILFVSAMTLFALWFFMSPWMNELYLIVLVK